MESSEDEKDRRQSPSRGRCGRPLALGRGLVASARPRPLRVSEAGRVWQQRPWVCSPKGWHTVLPVPTAPRASLCVSLSRSFPFHTTRQLDRPFPNGKSSSSYSLLDGCSACNRLEAGGAWWNGGRPQGGDQKQMSGGGGRREPTVCLELSPRRVCTPRFLSPWELGQ